MRYPHFLALALALGGAGLAATPETTAQTARAVRDAAEASMTLTGTIDIGTDGHVTGFQLDHADKVPADLVAFVQGQVQAWQFQPVVANGTAVTAQTPVSLRLLSRPSPDGAGDNVRVAGASFTRYDPEDTSRVTSVEARAPAYPKNLAAMRAKGDVLLLLKVGRDGAVEDVARCAMSLPAHRCPPRAAGSSGRRPPAGSRMPSRGPYGSRSVTRWANALLMERGRPTFPVRASTRRGAPRRPARTRHRTCCLPAASTWLTWMTARAC